MQDWKSVARDPSLTGRVGLELPLLPFTVPRSALGARAKAAGAFFLGEIMPSDPAIRDILKSVKTIALVGWSPRADRPSHGVAAYLSGRGYRVIPVNPGQAGVTTPWGEVVRASLSEISDEVDMVDIFRRSAEVGPVVDEALSHLRGLKVIWMQLGVVNEAAAARAEAAGLQVVMNRCPAIEIPRLGL